jgi:hypothetical protein
MSTTVNFIETELKENCSYCGRRRLDESEKFYKVFWGDVETEWIVCEFCKGGFLTRCFEGSEKTHATHLLFYVKRSLLGLKEKLPEDIVKELDLAIENYENGAYSASLRSIGLVSEWLTKKLFVKTFGEELAKDPKWENRLGMLLNKSKEDKRIPLEVLVYQLFSLKWFRNVADHVSEYKITAEDARIGLTSVIYLLHQVYSCNLI